MAFKAIETSDYNLLVVDETFLNGSRAVFGTDVRDSGNMTTLCYPEEEGPDLTCKVGVDERSRQLTQKMHEQVGIIQKRSTSFDFLDNKQCIDEYSRSLQSGRGDLLAITRQRTKVPTYYGAPTHYNMSVNSSTNEYAPVANSENSLEQECAYSEIPCLWILEGSLINFWSLTTTTANIFYDNQTYDSSDWMCSSDSGPVFQSMDDSCAPKALNPNDWKVNAQQIDHCRSEKVKQRCRLEFSISIGIIVIICNAVKLAVLAYTAIRLDEKTLCTVGYVAPAIDCFIFN